MGKQESADVNYALNFVGEIIGEIVEKLTQCQLRLANMPVLKEPHESSISE